MGNTIEPALKSLLEKDFVREALAHNDIGPLYSRTTIDPAIITRFLINDLGIKNPLEYLKSIDAVPGGYMNDMLEIKSVEIPDGIKHVYQYAFYRCYGLDTVKLPNTIQQICKYSFSTCSNRDTGLQIYYDGTTAQFRKIKKEKGWNIGTKVIVKCNNGEIPYIGY
jgi:hypothetical protein